MKRFIDLRDQGTGGRFAWFDTVKDEFETHSYCMTWDTFGEFVDDYKGAAVERYQSLAPDWAFIWPEDV